MKQRNGLKNSDDKENNIPVYVWKTISVDLTDEGFRKQLQTFKELIVKARPKAVCSDTREFLFTMPPEMKKWVNDDFF